MRAAKTFVPFMGALYSFLPLLAHTVGEEGPGAPPQPPPTAPNPPPPKPLPPPLTHSTTLSSLTTVRSLKAGLDAIRILYDINGGMFVPDKPRVAVLMTPTGLDVQLAFFPPDATQALPALLGTLGLFYDTTGVSVARHHQGSDKFTLAIPGGGVVTGEAFPGNKVEVWWRCGGRKGAVEGGGGERGGSITSADLAALLTLYTLTARAYSLSEGLWSGGADLPLDASAAVELAAAVTAMESGLPDLTAASSLGLPRNRVPLDFFNRQFMPPQGGKRRGGGAAAAASAATAKDAEGGEEEEESGEKEREGDATPSLPPQLTPGADPQQQQQQGGSALNPKTHPRAYLRSLGVKVYSKRSHVLDQIGWECLAGYEEVRKEVEEVILFPLQHPESYAGVTELTRVKPDTNPSCAYLFCGPPGTGKTTTARIIAAVSDRPLVCLSFENIGSPYYAQSEGALARVLEAISALPAGTLLFIDEAESMFPSRFFEGGAGGGVSAAVGNKLLSTLLKWLEGMDGAAKNSVILASNRAETLDPALLSRCAGTVTMALPTEAQRLAILKRYAKHLGEEEAGRFAKASEGLSGRDILQVCTVTERRHAAGLIRGGEEAKEVVPPTPPPFDSYLKALEEREDSLLGSGKQGGKGTVSAIEKWRRKKQGGVKGHDVAGV